VAGARKDTFVSSVGSDGNEAVNVELQARLLTQSCKQLTRYWFSFVGGEMQIWKDLLSWWRVFSYGGARVTG
jgi:hypothetical protein